MEKNKITIKEIKANGMTFKCRTAGLGNAGEPIIFLHGFPESSIMWSKFMISLADQGYQCLAPDQRGYSEGARPKGNENYAVDKLASDVVAIADQVGFKKFHLVGHDWGASAGWTTVQLFPERINDWTSLSVPHMAAYHYAKEHDPDQMEQAAYIGKFQIPIIPEIFLKLKNYKFLRELWVDHPAEDVEDYLAIFKKRSGRKGALGWYRGNKGLPFKFGDVNIPTLFIWGNQDFAIRRAGVDGTPAYMKGEYKYVELPAGHWLMQEQYENVTKEILDHIKSHPIN